jgi:hypothetical protein
MVYVDLNLLYVIFEADRFKVGYIDGDPFVCLTMRLCDRLRRPPSSLVKISNFL